MEICSTISPQQSIHRQKSKMLTIASLRIGMKEKRYAFTVSVNVKTEIQIAPHFEFILTIRTQ